MDCSRISRFVMRASSENDRKKATSGGSLLREIDDQARAPDEQLVTVRELLLASNAHEDACARA